MKRNIDLLENQLHNEYMSSAFGDLLKILRRFEKCLDKEGFDETLLKDLKLSPVRMKNYLEMLDETGYISGIVINEYIGEENPYSIDYDNARITIDGLKFLAENTVLAKSYRLIKGVTDIVKP